MSDAILLPPDATLVLLNPSQWQRWRVALSQSHRLHSVQAGFRALLNALNCPQSAGQLRRLAVNPSTDGSRWLCADPAYLQVAQSGARMVAIGQSMALTARELQQMQNDLAECFADHAMHLHAAGAGAFCVSTPINAPALIAAEPDAIFGAELKTNLPEPAFWRRVLNDVQIALNQSTLNQRRLESGQLPVNSLWLWGDESGVIDIERTLIGLSVESEDPILLALVQQISDKPAGRALHDWRFRTDLNAPPESTYCYWCSNGQIAIPIAANPLRKFGKYLSKLWQR